MQDKEFTAEDMAQTLMDYYQIDENTPLTHQQALHDAEAVAAQWRQAGIIDD